MEKIFDGSKIANVRHYSAIRDESEKYNRKEVYQFRITVRHAEDADPELLFQKAIDLVEPRAPQTVYILSYCDEINNPYLSIKIGVYGSIDSAVLAAKEHAKQNKQPKLSKRDLESLLLGSTDDRAVNYEIEQTTLHP